MERPPKVLFLALGDRTLASSRLRAWQVADAWPEASCQRWTGAWPDTHGVDVIILQKLWPNEGNVAMEDVLSGVHERRARGQRVFWDLCDPVWWWVPEEVFVEWAKAMDGIVVSSVGLAHNLKEELGWPSRVIQDRLPYEAHWRTHCPVEHPHLLWFGYAMNRMQCFATGALCLERLLVNRIPFRLTIMDDRPEWHLLDGSKLASCTTYVRWDLETWYDQLITADAAFLPSYTGIWGGFKSDNKDVAAAWAGLPILRGDDYQEAVRILTNHEYRSERGRILRHWAEEYREIHASVVEWQRVLAMTTRTPAKESITV